MSNSTIKLKTGTGSAVPSALAQGEVGINIDNGLIYYGSGSGNSVKQLESFTNITASGDISASGTITANAYIGLPSGLISSSAGVNANSITNFDSNVKDKLDTENVVSGSASNVRTFLNVESGADVTDATNVQAAGALMDSEVTNLSQVKSFDSSDYATAAQGTKADTAIQPADTGSFLTTVAFGDVTGKPTLVSSSAQIADVTLTTAAQTNITSLGTLTTLTVDDITINGSTISDGADLTIDAEGDITLDANGADVILKDNGTEFGRFKRDSSDFVIKSATNNKDIVFRGVDNSVTITALTLDMSDAGKAIFNSLASIFS